MFYDKLQYDTRPAVFDSGDSKVEQQYGKSGLLLVPEEDGLMVPKVYSSFEEYQEKCCDSGDSDEEKKAAVNVMRRNTVGTYL